MSMEPQAFRWFITIGWSGLESLSSIAVRYPGVEGQVYAQLIVKITMPGSWVEKFIEICAIIAIDRPFCSKRGNSRWL